MSGDVERQFVEICPWRIGQRVRVICPSYAADWPGEFVVTGLDWDYRRGAGKVIVSIASDYEIKHGLGATDGWTVDDLAPASA